MPRSADGDNDDLNSVSSVEVEEENINIEKTINACAKAKTVMFLLVRFMRDQDDSYEIVQILWLKDGRAK